LEFKIDLILKLGSHGWQFRVGPPRSTSVNERVRYPNAVIFPMICTLHITMIAQVHQSGSK
jgi:hypothetical protein